MNLLCYIYHVQPKFFWWKEDLEEDEKCRVKMNIAVKKEKQILVIITSLNDI